MNSRNNNREQPLRRTQHSEMQRSHSNKGGPSSWVKKLLLTALGFLVALIVFGGGLFMYYAQR